MKITSQVFQVGGSTQSYSADAAIYLIKDGPVAALIDAGTGGGARRVVDNIRSTGTGPDSIRYLFLTHCHYDHTGGALELQKATGSVIVAHALDAAFLEDGDSETTAASWYGSFMKPVAVDIKVTEGEKQFVLDGLTLNFYHTPGHSPGSSVLTVRSDDQLVLFGQDVHGPLNDVLRSSRKDYIRSLEFLLSLEADILCEGHFGVFFGREEVRNFIESYL
ncbi:MAG: MBL fold metallo-hydrolase [Spirochaetae bacterium HGW-Spirochaetae-1]|jgi:glyoxylase-like metal-dependent hydrolase (beta-lactamase superfamily II)|nr:MAG: MBL fold metallo-hydrolase [Spirochaetae bacterium HGW-Spirochaetae-1]